VLLHGVGDNALDWQWVIPALAHSHRVYAPDLPGSGGSVKPDVDYSPAFFTQFLSAFLDALKVERAVLVGNSLGGLVGLRLALSEPSRVSALGLVASAGLGREVTYALRSLALPGNGRIAVAWGKRAPGAAQRALGRATLLFARPQNVPLKWLKEQYRLARLPGFVEAQLATVRAQVGLKGQREVLVDRVGNARQGIPLLSSERGRLSSPRRVPRTHIRLRAPTTRRAARSLYGDRRSIPRSTGVPLMEVDRARPRRLVGERILPTASVASDTQVCHV
jgi:pimeloyl-ACP methyl ester carboxylesterase